MTVDTKILATLQRDGRATLAELSAATGLSASACSRRLAQLFETGKIRGVHADLDPELLSMQTIVIVQVSLHSQSESALREFELAVTTMRGLLSCDLMAGGVDYVLRIGVKDLATYERLHRHTLAALPGVSRVESSFVLRSIVDKRQPQL